MLALCCELLTLVPETRAAGLISLLLAISHKNAFTAKLGDMGGGEQSWEGVTHTSSAHRGACISKNLWLLCLSYWKLNDALRHNILVYYYKSGWISRVTSQWKWQQSCNDTTISLIIWCFFKRIINELQIMWLTSPLCFRKCIICQNNMRFLTKGEKKWQFFNCEIIISLDVDKTQINGTFTSVLNRFILWRFSPDRPSWLSSWVCIRWATKTSMDSGQGVKKRKEMRWLKPVALLSLSEL